MRFGIFAYYAAATGERIEMWVKSYNVDAYDGFGEIVFTKDPTQALSFPDMGAALECYRQQSTLYPLRADGQPNRPMTAYTVEITKLEEPTKH